ncbi:hypothetical protein C8J57DRAFT_1560874 [Mycena rebaudengoi]|nr:hypothetical protein C8J57DRAFT_1560874 [Mycena rebaudengoi]
MLAATNPSTPGMMFDVAAKPTGENLNRIELSELLMTEYLYAKQDWELERDNLNAQASQISAARTPKLTSRVGHVLSRWKYSSPDDSAGLVPRTFDVVHHGGSHPGFRAIRSQINAKSQQLDTLNAQLVALQMGTKGDPTELQNKVAAAQSMLAQTYSNNVISMVNTCLDAAGKVDISTLAGKLEVAQSVLADLPAQMETVKSAQDSLTAVSRALSQAMAAQALAEATDSKQQQQQIVLQIQSIAANMKELQTRWQLPPESSSGGSRWQSISIFSSETSRAQFVRDHAEAKVWGFVLVRFIDDVGGGHERYGGYRISRDSRYCGSRGLVPTPVLQDVEGILQARRLDADKVQLMSATLLKGFFSPELEDEDDTANPLHRRRSTFPDF